LKWYQKKAVEMKGKTREMNGHENKRNETNGNARKLETWNEMMENKTNKGKGWKLTNKQIKGNDWRRGKQKRKNKTWKKWKEFNGNNNEVRGNELVRASRCWAK
jgi:hypothetical protein